MRRTQARSCAASCTRARRASTNSQLSDLLRFRTSSSKERPQLKITGVRTLTVAAPPHRNWVFVKVETDQPGLYGWGEGTLEWKTRGVVGTVEDFVPILVGPGSARRHAHRRAAAADLVLAARRDRADRAQRHRAGVLGHQGQGSGPARLGAARRQGARPRARLYAYRRRQSEDQTPQPRHRRATASRRASCASRAIRR